MPSKDSLINPIAFIASQYTPDFTEISPIGNGLINDTFLVSTKTSPFILQRINRRVFSRPELIMENLKTLNQHLEKKNSASVRLKIPGILLTRDSKICFYDDKGDCWRALSFIANTESTETIANAEIAGQVGFALGHFHRLLSDLDPLMLQDTLPGFHITPGYLNCYHQVLNRLSVHETTPENHYCADFIASFEQSADILESAKQQGLLPLRVIHGDPKLNNFLFDLQNGTIASIIDLDTVKPGLVHYDIGDCLRSCCHNVETDTFDLAICAAILKKYFVEAAAFFSEPEYRFLYPAIELIPFELGLRFYTDYLDGDRYFKVSEPRQNLHRACAQFRLCASIKAQKKTIEQLIENLKNKTMS